MARGGARARSGPAPDPNALRRERKSDGEWTVLPAAGRTGRVPEWPMPEPDARELDLWASLWRRPQAVQWERHGQHLEVALYVRRLVEAEERGSSVALSTLVRQLGDSLGLTAPGMRSLRWKLSDPEEPGEAAARPKAGAARSAGSSARDRLRVIGGEGA